MSKQNFDLWKRIDGFQFDKEGVELSFAKRLARENDWSYNYALEVIAEYKKFVYICCISDQPVTPSDAVDQVWHLHLTYTRNYWTEFCANTLGQMLHHEPTKGGPLEEMNFVECYVRLKQLYLQEFGSRPRADIWPSVEERFSAKNLAKRVQSSDYWIISKSILRSVVVGFVVVITGLLLFLALLTVRKEIEWRYVIIFAIIAIVISIVLFIIKNLKYGKDNRGGGCVAGSGCSGCGGGCGG